MTERELPNGDCVWDDCDQKAEFCPGHALEYGNVSDENDAIRLRHAIITLERQRDELLRTVRTLLQSAANDTLSAQGWADAGGLLFRIDRLIATQKAAEQARRRAR